MKGKRAVTLRYCYICRTQLIPPKPSFLYSKNAPMRIYPLPVLLLLPNTPLLFQPFAFPPTLPHYPFLPLPPVPPTQSLYICLAVCIYFSLLACFSPMRKHYRDVMHCFGLFLCFFQTRQRKEMVMLFWVTLNSVGISAGVEFGWMLGILINLEWTLLTGIISYEIERYIEGN